MLSKLVTGSGESNRYVMVACMKEFRKIRNRIRMPVPADEHNSVFLIQGLKETVYAPCNFTGVKFIFNRGGCRETVFQLVQSNILDTVSFCCGICVILLDCEIPNNAADITQKRIWSLRRYCVPRSEICVIHTFFCIPYIVQYIVSNLCAYRAILAR